ncbi:hypothetical protein PBOI14_40190 [Pseudomonas sp. Boi14]|nr:hypothetical protein PBOI14_40190 [Pseudomonas sp. Boi14]
MNFTTILFSISEGVALLSLNRPEQLNSFNPTMHREVQAALDLVRNDPQVRVLLLTGEGRGFCAGQDLGERTVAPGGAAPDLGASIETFYNPLVRALRDLPLPVICAVNGVAAGPGPTCPWPAIWYWPHARQALSRPSASSGWFPIPAVPGCCRAWWAWPGPRPWPCSAAA